jgi:hypothetical protein
MKEVSNFQSKLSSQIRHDRHGLDAADESNLVVLFCWKAPH